MGQPLPDRHRRRKTFLRALVHGATPGAAAAAAGIKRSTLYAWRRDGPRFRAAWDDAVAAAGDLHQARFETALFERALKGVEVPVVRGGRIVGTRKRYDDRALMLAWQWLRTRRAAETPPPLPPGRLAQHRVDPGLPAGTGGAEMRQHIGIEADADGLLGRRRFRPAARPCLAHQPAALTNLGAPEPLPVEPGRLVRISPSASANGLLLRHGHTSSK